LQSYRDAITTFEEDLKRVGKAIAAVKEGKLWKKLLTNVTTNENKITWDLEDLPPEIESRFVYNLVAGHGFQQSIDSLKHLQYLKNSLKEQARNVGIYRYILDLRRETYEERLPKLAPEKGDHRMAALKDERDLYWEEYERIEREGDLKALADVKERDLIVKLETIQDTLRRNKNSMDPKEYNEALRKYRLFSGLLEWEIGTSIAPRLWKIKSGLRDLDKALEKATHQQKSLQRARLNAPRGFEGYSKRIKGYASKIKKLQAQVQDTIDEQKQSLEEQVIAELSFLQQRLAGYLDQAKFAVAHLQDMGSNQGGGK
jgi:hypothetical protein